MFSKGREEKSDNVSTGRIETVYYWRTLELENRITRFLHKVRLPLLLEDFNSIICLTGNGHGARNCLQKTPLCIIFFAANRLPIEPLKSALLQKPQILDYGHLRYCSHYIKLEIILRWNMIISFWNCVKIFIFNQTSCLIYSSLKFCENALKV